MRAQMESEKAPFASHKEVERENENELDYYCLSHAGALKLNHPSLFLPH